MCAIVADYVKRLKGNRTAGVDTISQIKPPVGEHSVQFVEDTDDPVSGYGAS
jgi:hypothetical protein